MDPYAEMRRSQSQVSRRLRDMEHATRGSTLVGMAAWAAPISGSFSVMGSSDVGLPSYFTIRITTPANRRLSFVLLGLFWCEANGAATADIIFRLKQDGVTISEESTANTQEATPQTIRFTVDNLLPGMHEYTWGWTSSDLLNIRHLTIGPDKTTFFFAETRP